MKIKRFEFNMFPVKLLRFMGRNERGSRDRSGLLL